MKINYVIPSMAPGQPASAGSACLYEYINGLSERGHEVTVVPLEYFGMPGPQVKFKGKIIIPDKTAYLKKKIRGMPHSILRRLGFNIFEKLKEKRSIPKIQSSYIKHRFETLANVINAIPECDINIATAYQTALAVYLSGKGIQFYHLQHFEEYFSVDSVTPEFALKEASLTYGIPLIKIANCTWLKNEVEKHYPQERVVAIINYGINTNIFYPRGIKRLSSLPKIISYGGRHFKWKGFIDAVEAIRMVRIKYPEIEWIVFGDTSIPQDNKVAKFKAAGFLVHERLAELYSECDIMLCPSWYESFPLYPLEAMACGLAVVTTPLGTEDYAKDGINCLIAPAKSPNVMAEAIIKLIEDKSLRAELGDEGIRTARRFTWDQSVNELEKVLLEYAQ